MKNLKDKNSFLNEAKSFPVGSVLKVTDPNRLGIEAGSWTTFKVKTNSEVPAEEGLFYFEVEESGRAWLEGRLLYTNSLLKGETERTYTRRRSVTAWTGAFKVATEEYKYPSRVRVSVNSAHSPGPEYAFFKKNEEEIVKIMTKKFYVEGNESVLMNAKGETAKDTKEGEYSVEGVNFKLTAEFKEPVMFLVKGNDQVFVKLSDTLSLGGKLTDEQRDVMAKWFTKKLGFESIKRAEHHEDKYDIAMFKVTSANGSFSAGPFYSTSQAEEAMKAIQAAHKGVSTYDSLSVKPDTSKRLTQEELVKLVKSNGIDFSMKDILKTKRGEVTGSKFGI